VAAPNVLRESRLDFYGSLRTVKVLLAPLRSTLTVLASPGEGVNGFTQDKLAGATNKLCGNSRRS
jgi:hypothetical protein